MGQTQAAQPWEVVIEAGPSLHAELAGIGQELQDAFERLTGEFGLLSLDVASRVAKDLAPRQFRVMLPASGNNGAPVEGLPPGTVLVRDTLFRVETLMQGVGGDWPHPPIPGVLVRDRSKAAVMKAGCSDVLDPVQHLLQACALSIRRGAASLITAASVTALQSRLPRASAQAVQSAMTDDETAQILRGLLAENVSIASYPDFALALADPARVAWCAEDGQRRHVAALPGHVAVAAPKPPGQDAQRNALARAIAVPRMLRRRAAGGELAVWSLALDVAWTIVPDGAAWKQALADAIAPCGSVGGVLVTPPRSRRALWQRLAPHWPDLLVVSGHELPRGVRLRPMPGLTPPP